MDDLTALRNAFDGTDPANDVRPTPEARQRARLHAIAKLEEHTTMARPLWKRVPVLAAGAATAALAVGAGVVILPGDDHAGIPLAYAAQPDPIEVTGGDPVDGTEPLTALAGVTEARGAAPGDGEVGFVATTGTRLHQLTANAGDDDPDETHGYRFVPYDWTSWEDLEGNTRQDSEPKPPLEAGGEEADHEWFLEQGSESYEDTVHESLVWPAELPTDTDGMLEALADFGEGPADESLPALANAADRLYESRPLSGAEEAAVQRVFAEVAEVAYLGTATDTLNREGELFAFTIEDEGRVSEVRYLYDAEDGALLYRDVTLLEEGPEYEGAASFGLEYPLLTEQVGFVWSGWVGEIGERP
ncbi:CU044_5270 family protein [Nocardiopsis sp. NPDC006938]|uniref:CU044_5270 family protein n=1 Tax=Nocardiopsis sp. NPDC006938 TaxID=3364337 RepID=UPI00367A1A98